MLSSKCAIPDKNGDFVRGRCEFNLIRNVLHDGRLFNYIYSTFRKASQGKLNIMAIEGEEERLEGDKSDHEEEEKEESKEVSEADDEDTDNIEGVGEDEEGYLIWRMNEAYSNNYMINAAAISFTNAKGAGDASSN